jgi:hypothetical protein
MNLSIHSLSCHASWFVRTNLFPSLNALQKKILTIAALALACVVAACYIASFYIRKPVQYLLPFLNSPSIDSSNARHIDHQTLLDDKLLESSPSDKNTRTINHKTSFQHLTFESPDPSVLEGRKNKSLADFEALKLELQALDHAMIQISEDILSHYLAKLYVNFTAKKIVVLSIDLGGYGDFTFGFKTLGILNNRFLGIQSVLATDSPTRALKVNGTYNQAVLTPHQPSKEKLTMTQVVDMIAEFNPDLFIVAPVTHVSREPFQKIMQRIPSLFIREYGFGKRLAYTKESDYISGAGVDEWKGIMIHQEMLQWSESGNANHPLVRLSQLQHLPNEVVQAILGSHYSDQAILDFSNQSELFMAYGNDLSKVEFILAILGMQQKLNSTVHPCFVLLGQADNLPALLKEYRQELINGEIGTIEWINIDHPQHSTVEVIDPKFTKRMKLILVSLLPEDVLHLIKASEREVLTTGDQSWSECISAHKHWVQQYLIHKRDSVQGVINLVKEQSDYAQNTKFFTLLKDANLLGNLLKIVPKRSQAQAELFFLSRTDKFFAKCWEELNSLICYHHTIEPWLVGIVIKKYLEHQYPSLKERMEKILQEKQISAIHLSNFLNDAQQFLLE